MEAYELGKDVGSTIGGSVSQKLEETGVKDGISNIAKSSYETGKSVGSSVYTTGSSYAESGYNKISQNQYVSGGL